MPFTFKRVLGVSKKAFGGCGADDCWQVGHEDVIWTTTSLRRRPYLTNNTKYTEEAPGYEHWELTYYQSEHGNPKDVKNVVKGHVEGVHEGVIGVFIPDKPITKIKFSKELSAEVRSQLGATNEDISPAMRLLRSRRH